MIDQGIKVLLNIMDNYQNVIVQERKQIEITGSVSVNNMNTKKISQKEETSNKIQNHLRVLESVIRSRTEKKNKVKNIVIYEKYSSK